MAGAGAAGALDGFGGQSLQLAETEHRGRPGQVVGQPTVRGLTVGGATWGSEGRDPGRSGPG